MERISRRASKIRFLLTLLCAILLCVPALHAQTTATLLGTVSDQSGAVVPNAKVTLQNESSGDVRTTETNQIGRFTFAAIEPGTYTIQIAAANFRGWKRNGFVMNASDTRSLDDIKLEVGSTAENVTVVAESTQIELVSNGERSAVLTSHDIDKLALIGRNVTELFKVLPGVASTPSGWSNGEAGGTTFTNSGPTGSALGNGLTANGAPYRGGTVLLMDGANVIDQGCNCWANAVPNPEFTQEVKVQTSNFGADQANGPVVFSAISKAGGNSYHGALFFNARNYKLNANTWANNNNKTPRPDDAYYYPGGDFGGPVPGTKGKLLFFSGFEYWWQKLPAGGALTAWVPTDAMRRGNFDLSDPQNAAYCSNYDFNTTDRGTLRNSCADLGGTRLKDGTTLPAGTTQLPSSAIDQNMLALMNLYNPEPNADPSKNGGQYNWFMPVSSQQNGWVLRNRLDYNFSNATQLFVSYQFARNESAEPSHMWWHPTSSVEFPGGGLLNKTKSRTAAVNFVHIFSPTLTSESILTWNKTTSPTSPSDFAAVLRTGINWPYSTIYGNGNNSLMLPSVSAGYSNQWYGDVSQPNVFGTGGSFPLTKQSPSFSENVTKAYKSHTFKAGFFYSMTNNNQPNWADPNGTLTFGPVDTAKMDTVNQIDGQFYGSRNPTANYLMGFASSYTEMTYQAGGDVAARTYAFYGMDDWKVSKRINVNLGLRMNHVGRWYDRQNTGMAVWLPDLYSSDLAAGRQNPGLRWHGTDPGIPASGSTATVLNPAPRFGISWDLFGTGKTIVRGGYGYYHWMDEPAGALSAAEGATEFNLNGGKSVWVDQINPILPRYLTTGSTTSNAFTAEDYRDHNVPLTKSWNMTISQQLPWRSLLEVAYVGSSSSNLQMGGSSGSGGGLGGADFVNINKIPLHGLFQPDPVTGAAAPADPENTGSYNYSDYFPYYAGYGTNSMKVVEHTGYSNYHSLQLAWAKQSGPLTFQANYTWSKALGMLNETVDPFNIDGNYGILNIDRPHVVKASYSYDIGDRVHGNKVLQGVVNGWSVSGITNWQKGGNIQSGYGSQNLGLSLYDASGSSGITTKTFYGTNVGEILPVYTCAPGKTYDVNNPDGTRLGTGYVDTNCITAPDIGQYGDRQAPYLHGPSFFGQDLALRKSFRISERQKIEIRMSGNNIFNHPNSILGLNGSLRYNRNGSGWVFDKEHTGNSWGVSTQKDGQRILMLGAKYTF